MGETKLFFPTALEFCILSPNFRFFCTVQTRALGVIGAHLVSSILGRRTSPHQLHKLPETFSKLSLITVREIHQKIDATARRGVVGGIVKRVRHSTVAH